MYIVNIINKLHASRYADNCNVKISIKVETKLININSGRY